MALCERCGKKETSSSYSKYCYQCDKITTRDRELAAIESGDGESISGDEIYCPWCGYEYEPFCDESDFFQDGTIEAECPECKKDYDVSVTIRYYYETTRIP